MSSSLMSEGCLNPQPLKGKNLKLEKNPTIKVGVSHWCRRADMAEQRAGRAEQAQHDAHNTVGQVEAQLALLARQLHQAREDHHGLQEHFEVRRSLPAALCA